MNEATQTKRAATRCITDGCIRLTSSRNGKCGPCRALRSPLKLDGLPAGQVWEWPSRRPVTPKPEPRAPSTSYKAVHARLRAALGRASDHECRRCDRKAQDWAYDKSDPNALSEINARGATVKYSADLARYMPLCRSCHTKLDRAPYQPSLFMLATFELPPLPKRGYAPRLLPEATGMSATCPRCTETRDLAWFATDRSKASGHKSWCKPCDADVSRQKYAARGVVKPAGNRSPRARTAADQSSYHANRSAAIEVYGGKCEQCGSIDGLQFDHLYGDGQAHRAVESHYRMHLRIARTGERLPYVTLQLLCKPCHDKKSARDQAHGRGVLINTKVK